MVDHFDEIINTRKQFNISDTILIVGSPRSGTTWLLELLGKIPSYRLIFEPLNPTWYPESIRMGFKSRTYRSIDSNWLEGEEYLKRIFTGKVTSSKKGPSYINSPKYLFFSLIANKLCIKEVRMNRLLPWIAKRFELKKIFLIIRHPCAVVSSQLKTGYTAYHPTSPPYKDIIPSLEDILNEVSEIDGLNPNVYNKLKFLKTPDELLAAAWCLDNYVPLYKQKQYGWKIVFYEKLYQEQEMELRNIFNVIGFKNIPKSVIANLKEPSYVTRKNEWKTIQSKDKQLTKWKESLSEKQISRILKVVSYFDMDFYTNDIEPDYDFLNKDM